MDAYSSGEEVIIKTRKPYTITKQRERWTGEEHNRFLEALKLYGRAWQRIEEHIGTKTAVQIRSHAQKFFSKLEKEALVKGVPIGQAIDIDIPPPRPKRKPSNPYPRKTSGGTPTSLTGVKDGKQFGSVSSSHNKTSLDLEKEPFPEKTKGDEMRATANENKKDSISEEVFTIFQEPPSSSISSANKISMPLSVPLRNCSLKEFIPSVKEVTAQDKTDESFVTFENKENRNLEEDNAKQKQQNNCTSKGSRLENHDPLHVKLVQDKKTDEVNWTLPRNVMQGSQNYPRHVPVYVLDGGLGVCTQTPTDMPFRDSIFYPMGRVNGQPDLFTNAGVSNTSENQSDTERSSVHQSFPAYPSFTAVCHNQEDYQSFLHISTFSSLIVSALLQNPAAHAAASFAATFWPYSNVETSVDSPASNLGGLPTRQIGSPPSVAAVAAATVAAATAWWAAHGLLPLSAPLHAAFGCTPASTMAMTSTDTAQAPASRAERGETNLEKAPLQDQLLDPEYSEAHQAQDSASKSPAMSSSDSDSGGGTKSNSNSKAINVNDEMNEATGEHNDPSKTKGRKQVDRSSCGSNTPSSSEIETDALEKDDKMKEEPKEPDTNHPASEPSYRRSRSSNNITDSWKEVSEEGRLAFQALFSREVLPQSFSPPHHLKNQGSQDDKFQDNKQTMDKKDGDVSATYLNKEQCGSSSHQGEERNKLLGSSNSEEEGLLSIGLGKGKLKSRRTGFKPYKRCSVEAKENRVGNVSAQGDEKGPKRIRLEGEASI